MKEYEKWTANIEAKIGEAKRKKARRASLVKKLAAVVTCMVLLAGSAFAVSYYMRDDPAPSIVPNATDTGVQVTVPDHTIVMPYTGDGYVSYKTETGEYSWLDGKGGSAIGGSHEFCPEGHYDNMGFSSYHSIPMNLTLYVYGISRDSDWGAELDKTVKKRNYEKLGSRIAGKCDGETVRNYIDEFGVTREEFDEILDLVEEYAFNLDVLYGDYEYCDEYYKYTKIFERRQEMYHAYKETVRAIFDYYNIPDGLAKDSAENDRRFDYSIPELAYHYGLSQDELRAVIEESNRFTDYELTFNYDFSVIYNEDGAFREELSALDVRESGFEAAVDYAAEFGEAFCRVYEWEDPAEIGDVKNEGGESDNPYDGCDECAHDGTHRAEHYAALTNSKMKLFIRNCYQDRDGVTIRRSAKYDGLSTPELVRVGNISREELLAIIAEVKRREEASQVYYGGAYYQYDYDLDVIYNEDGSFKDLSGYGSGTLQAMFTGDESYIESYAE